MTGFMQVLNQWLDFVIVLLQLVKYHLFLSSQVIHITVDPNHGLVNCMLEFTAFRLIYLYSTWKLKMKRQFGSPWTSRWPCGCLLEHWTRIADTIVCPLLTARTVLPQRRTLFEWDLRLYVVTLLDLLQQSHL